MYVYNSLADFYADANNYLNPSPSYQGKASLFQVRYNNIPGSEKPVQPLDVYYWGAYAQDEFQITNNVKVTLGLRFDIPSFGATGFDNAVADTMTFRDETGIPSGTTPANFPMPAFSSPRASDSTGMSSAIVPRRYAAEAVSLPANRLTYGFPTRSEIPVC